MSDFSDYNLTPSAKSALIKAQEIASEYGQKKVIDIHLLYSIFTFEHTNIDFAMHMHGWLKEGFMTALEMVLAAYKEPKRKHKIYADEIYAILLSAEKIAKKNKDEFIGIDHILVALLRTRQDIGAFFIGLNVDITQFCTTLTYTIRHGVNKAPPPPVVGAIAESAPPTKTKQDISEWCENMNQKIKKRGTFEIFGRDSEIERTFEILLRKNKSNVILVGEAGVGKTAIVEGLSERILQNKCPSYLKNKKILSLDMTSVLAGTMYRGQMEEKVQSIIDEISNNEDYILFIDEIHTIVGAGSSEGGLDLANSLKPVLSRGGFACIGATTEDEYNKYFKGDSALNRRFEKIDVHEPNIEETIKLMKKAKTSYEKFHNVKFSLNILKLIINLCDSYLPSKKFPDKAFDVIDEAGVKAKIHKKDDQITQVDKQTIYEIFARKLNTSVENVKGGDNIIIPGKIGF